MDITNESILKMSQKLVYMSFWDICHTGISVILSAAKNLYASALMIKSRIDIYIIANRFFAALRMTILVNFLSSDTPSILWHIFNTVTLLTILSF